MVYTFRAGDSRLKPCIAPSSYRFIGLAVKAFASRVEDPGFNAHLRCRDFSHLSHTSDLKICTPVVTLRGAWHNSVSIGTGWPGVSTLCEVESWICNFCLDLTHFVPQTRLSFLACRRQRPRMRKFLS